MEQVISDLSIRTKGEGFTNITNALNKWIKDNRLKKGILVLTSKHTSCSLIINENADPRVLKDLSAYMKAIVPELGFKSISGDNKEQRYLHSEEGVDDMPAHIRTTLTCTSLTMSIKNSRLDLGTWQAIYLWEHRYTKKERIIGLHSIAEKIKIEETNSNNSLKSLLQTNSSRLNEIYRSKNQNSSISLDTQFISKKHLSNDPTDAIDS